MKKNKKRSLSVSSFVQRKDWAHWAGWMALVSVLAFAALVNLAIQHYPVYSYSSNFLSDLGVSAASAAYFNSALILVGLGLVFFAVALHKSQRYAVRPAALLLLASAGFCLAGVGLFTERVQPLHLIATGGFFLFTALAILLTGYDWVQSGKVFGWVGLAGGVFLVGFVIVSALSFQPILQKGAVGVTALGYFILGLGIIHDTWKK